MRQVLAVSAGEKPYLSPAVGRGSASRRWKSSRPSGTRAADPGGESYPAFVEGRIWRLAETPARGKGIGRYSDEQLALAAGVRRQPAWPEIAGLVGPPAVRGVRWSSDRGADELRCRPRP